MDGEAFIDCTVSELAAQTRNSLVGGPFGSDLVSGLCADRSSRHPGDEHGTWSLG
jgi:hypothetical protein